jgi:hypothetical protein
MDLLVNKEKLLSIISTIYDAEAITTFKRLSLNQIEIISNNKDYQEALRESSCFYTRANYLIDTDYTPNYIIYLTKVNLIVLRDEPIKIKPDMIIFNLNDYIFESLSYEDIISVIVNKPASTYMHYYGGKQVSFVSRTNSIKNSIFKILEKMMPKSI